MKIEVTDLSPVRKRLSAEADPEEVLQETEGVLRGYRQKARIPGFRAGKAPLAVIRARFAKEVREDVRDRLVTRVFREASTEKGLRPLGRPELEEIVHEEGQPFRLRTVFDVLPEIRVHRHQGVEVRRPSIRVVEADIDRALEELRQSRIQLVTEEGRQARSGDVVVADVEGRPSEGEPFEHERVGIEIGAAGNPPGFDPSLTGVSAGARPEFAAKYPEDHPDAALAGKDVAFRLRVHEVKRRDLPALDDDLAKDLGLESLAELRRRMGEDLEKRLKRDAESAVRQAVLDQVLLENPVALPDVLVEDAIRRRMEDLVRRMIHQGLEPEKMEIDWTKVRSQQQDPARKSVHARLILDAVARQESIDVEASDVERRIEQDALRSGEDPKRLRHRLEEHSGLEAIRAQMVREKVLDYLTALANIRNEE